MKLFSTRLLQVITVLCPVIWIVGLALMLVNMGVIKIKPHVPVDESLIYNGEYIDLLDYQQASLDEADMRITLIDERTGLPAATHMALIGKNGKEVSHVDVVRFEYQGMPVILRFTDNVASGYTYPNGIFNFGGNIEDQWETDPNVLRQILQDYSSQVLTVLR